MTGVGEKWDVAKLDGSNWAAWKFQMRHLLVAKDLWEHVEGTAQDPGAEAAARAAHEKASQKAMATLALGISPKLVYLVTSCTTPKDFWDTLKAQFERNTLASKLLLKRQFFTAKMKEGQPAQEHLRLMKENVDKLAALGAVVAEEEQVVALLISLPPSYGNLVTALETKGDDLTLEFVKQSIINEELKRQANKSQRATEPNDDSALHAFKQDRIPFTGECFKCHKIGHKGFECRGSGGRGRGGRGRNSRFQRGHSAKTAEDQSGPSSDLFLMTTGFVATGKTEPWVMDSGCSRHMTFSRERLQDYTEFQTPETVRLGDGHVVEAYGEGRVQLTVDLGYGRTRTTGMTNVLYVPKLVCNLFSVRAATRKGLVVQFGHTYVWMKDSRGILVGKGRLVDPMYQLDTKDSSPNDYIESGDQAHQAKEVKLGTADMWHQRLGHLNEGQLTQAVNKGQIKGINPKDVGKLSFCQGCVEGKMCRKPFKAVSEIRSTRKLELVHSDVCGPMSVESFGGKRYFLTLIDDYSRAVKVYFLRKKSEVFEKFKEFEASATNETGCKIGCLRTDNGGEYMSEAFESYLKEKGIKHESSVPHCPQQNGVAERMNRTLVESAKAMTFHAGLSKRYWAEAVTTAAFIRNRVVTSASGETPHERWYEKVPDVSNFKVFGCMAYALIHEGGRKKLDKKTVKLRFIGYDLRQKGYRLYNPETQKVVVRRDVAFNEKDFGSKSKPTEVDPEQRDFGSESKPTEVDLDDEPFQWEPQGEPEGNGGMPVEPQEEMEQEGPEPVNGGTRRSQRPSMGCPPRRYGHEVANHVAFHVEVGEPRNLKEAMASPHAAEWKKAAESEYQSLISNQTWDLVPLPQGKTVVGCRWIFKVKRKADGEIDRFKARLVAQGFSQEHGVNYQEVYAPVVRYSSIRCILAISNKLDLELHQMDVKTAFLNGRLSDEIYMKQPVGFEKDPSKVCILKRSLYGLKQAARMWNFEIDGYLKQAGYIQSKADSCVYVKSGLRPGEIFLLALYVDDLLLASNNKELLKAEKAALGQAFEMVDQGEAHFILGMTIERDRPNRVLKLGQKKYLEGVLERFEMKDCKAVKTPMEGKEKLLPNPEKVCDEDLKKKYQAAIGCLTYASGATRPDLSIAVNVLSHFAANPTKEHWGAVKRVFRYIQGSLNQGLVFRSDPEKEVTLIGYSDADWAGDVGSRKSVNGYIFLLSGGVVSWRSQRQSVVALSSTEAEYVAMTAACKEMVWLRQLLEDMGFKQEPPTTLFGDNQSALSLAKNPAYHDRTKHVAIKYHFIREKVNAGDVKLVYCPTTDMLADGLTKAQGSCMFEKFKEGIGLG